MFKFNKVVFGSFFGIPNKFWELQITNEFEGPYFDFSINWTRKQDHAGFQFFIEILDLMIDFKIYDARHWDWDKQSFI